MKNWLLLPNVCGIWLMQTNENLTPKRSLAHNGKSFHWAGRFLDAEIGQDATHLYSFCRILDDMADGDISNGPTRLRAIRFGLINRSTTEDLLLPELTDFIVKKKISVEIMTTLIDGLLQDQGIVAIKDEAALLQYCYRVAGTVGLMMSQIIGYAEQEALLHAIDLGIAMQLTNIARDVLEDATMDRRYLPETWVGDMPSDQIVSLSDNGACKERDNVNRAVKRLLDLSETYYDSGLKGLVYLRPRDHLAIAVAAKVYRQIGVQISDKGYKWYNGREATTKWSKLVCTIKSTQSLPGRLMRKPDHQKSLHTALIGLPYVG
ncbi:phytoene/squalene synthase family protein [Amylibacter sp.]|nr:phytoene/squalene synthase family protein [Amylibacter sp.]